MRLITRAPVTALLIFVAVVLHVLVQSDRRGGETLESALWRWNALQWTSWPDEPELTGLLSLWERDRPYRNAMKRVAASLAHHGSLLSLALSCSLFGLVGSQVEPRWGHFRFFVVCLLLSLAGFSVAWMVQETPLGLFTPACGLVFAAGRRSAAEGEDAGGEVGGSGETSGPAMARWVLPVTVGAVIVVLMATVSGWGHGPYIAWLTSMTCGWRSGAGLPPTADDRRLLPAFRLLPVLVACGVWGALHPVWLGTYHWQRAHEKIPGWQAEERLRRAIRVEPRLAGPRLELARLMALRGQYHAAWQNVLEGWRLQPRDARFPERAREVWRGFQNDGERTVALQTLRDLFGAEAAFRETQLALTAAPPSARGDFTGESDPSRPSVDAERRFPLDQKVDLPTTPDGGEERPRRTRPLPAPDPNVPDSAAEGRRT